MPSENKTKNLGLNQWQGNEYAKRQDFVDDNKKIDDAIGELKNTIGNVKIPVTSVNNKDGNVVLKAIDITTEDNKTIEQNIKEVKSSLDENTKKITNINEDLNNVMAQGKIKKIVFVEAPPTIENAEENTLYLAYE